MKRTFACAPPPTLVEKPAWQKVEGASVHFQGIREIRNRQDVAPSNADDGDDELVEWQQNIASLGVGLFYLLLMKAKIILLCLLFYLFVVYFVG